MAISHKIWNFPIASIRSQLFHVPGSYFDGGSTSGGARIMSPEPGGRSVLEMEVSLQVNEWKTPFSSWLMSKINGEIFKIQLTKTPQLVSMVSENNYNLSKSGVPWENDKSWENGMNWNGDGFIMYPSAESLEGQTGLQIETLTFGEVLKHGHVIGVGNYSYIIDDVSYNGTIANVTIKPPLRTNVAIDDTVYMRPYFLGTIANGSEIRASYEASNIGHVQLNRIVFNEAIINV